MLVKTAQEGLPGREAPGEPNGTPNGFATVPTCLVEKHPSAARFSRGSARTSSDTWTIQGASNKDPHSGVTPWKVLVALNKGSYSSWSLALDRCSKILAFVSVPLFESSAPRYHLCLDLDGQGSLPAGDTGIPVFVNPVRPPREREGERERERARAWDPQTIRSRVRTEMRSSVRVSDRTL